MKKFLILFVLICAITSTAKSQGCPGCTPQQRADQDRAADARRNDPEIRIRQHDEWPARPTVQRSGKQYYTRIEARFAVVNDTAKKVKSITWECTLLHPETNNQLAKYTIVSRKKIAPYGGAILKEKVAVPLNSFYGPKVVSADQVTTVKSGLPDNVQAVQVNKILEILYTDGSVTHLQ